MLQNFISMLSISNNKLIDNGNASKLQNYLDNKIKLYQQISEQLNCSMKLATECKESNEDWIRSESISEGSEEQLLGEAKARDDDTGIICDVIRLRQLTRQLRQGERKQRQEYRKQRQEKRRQRQEERKQRQEERQQRQEERNQLQEELKQLKEEQQKIKEELQQLEEEHQKRKEMRLQRKKEKRVADKERCEEQLARVKLERIQLLHCFKLQRELEVEQRYLRIVKELQKQAELQMQIDVLCSDVEQLEQEFQEQVEHVRKKYPVLEQLKPVSSVIEHCESMSREHFRNRQIQAETEILAHTRTAKDGSNDQTNSALRSLTECRQTGVRPVWYTSNDVLPSKLNNDSSKDLNGSRKPAVSAATNWVHSGNELDRHIAVLPSPKFLYSSSASNTNNSPTDAKGWMARIWPGVYTETDGSYKKHDNNVPAQTQKSVDML